MTMYFNLFFKVMPVSKLFANTNNSIYIVGDIDESMWSLQCMGELIDIRVDMGVQGLQVAKQGMRLLKLKEDAMGNDPVVSELLTVYLEIHASEPLNT